MNRQILAICVQEAGRLVSGLLSLRTPKLKPSREYQPAIAPPAEPQEISEERISEESKASSIEAGCVPCAIGHFGTCSGLLSEGMRFARGDGISSTEVIDRVNKCLDELNTMERVDLTEEKIATLPPWEKAIAEKALLASRKTRHGLEATTSLGQLEQVTAQTQTARKEIGREWFKERLAQMSPEEKVRLSQKVEAKIKSV